MDHSIEHGLLHLGHKITEEVNKNPAAAATAVAGSVIGGAATLAGVGGVVGTVATGALTAGSTVAGIATAAGATTAVAAATGAVVTAAVIAAPVAIIGGAIFGLYTIFKN